MDIATATAPSGVRLAAEATLPTRFGLFRICAFEGLHDGQELIALTRGELQGAEGVVVRLHSECFTGDVMCSLRCDCREQLELALQHISREQQGAIVYLRQEGRGIGLINKIKAYALQERGLDTVEANLALGFLDDHRRYDLAADVVHALGIRSLWLLTNNPEKQRGLERHGVTVLGRLPLRVAPNEHNAFYLDTKRRRSGHLL